MSKKFKIVPGLETHETIEFLFHYNIKNRPLVEDKVNHFMKKFREGQNYLREQPGLVDEETWDIFDGQHRYEACKRLTLLGESTPFVFRWKPRDSELTVDRVTEIQTNAGSPTRRGTTTHSTTSCPAPRSWRGRA